MKLEGKAKMLRIHFGEDDKWYGKPLYEGHRSQVPRTGYRRRLGVSRDRGVRRQLAHSQGASAAFFRSPNHGLGDRY